MAKVFNRVLVATATTGTGTMTLGAAEDSFQTFAAAGAVNADVVEYFIRDGSAWEVGTGTIGGGGTTLTRTVTESSNSDAAINLSGDAVVGCGISRAAFDAKAPLASPVLTGNPTAPTQTAGNNTTRLASTAFVATGLAGQVPRAGNVTLTGGIDSDVQALGTVSSGTVTLEVDAAGKENFKTLTANGAFTLAPPSTSSSCTIIVQVTNGASAGTITTSGFTMVNGDAYETTSGNDYLFHVKKIGSFTSLTVEALQ